MNVETIEVEQVRDELRAMRSTARWLAGSPGIPAELARELRKLDTRLLLIDVRAGTVQRRGYSGSR